MKNSMNRWNKLPVWEAADEGTPSAVTGADAGAEGKTPPSEEGQQEAKTPADGQEVKTPEDKPTPPAPVTLEDLSLPEGFEIPEEHREGFLAVVNDENLSRAEMVNKLIEMQSEAGMSSVAALEKVVMDQWTATQTEWQQALAAVPEFGGDKLDENLAEVKKGLEAAGATKEVFDALDVTGAGNHPALVPLLHKLTAQYREAKPITASPAKGALSREQRMFPSMIKE